MNSRLNNTFTYFFQQMLVMPFIETQCGLFFEGYFSHLAPYGFISKRFALTVGFQKKEERKKKAHF